jgi:hypothetical protein
LEGDWSKVVGNARRRPLLGESDHWSLFGGLSERFGGT